MQKVLLVEDDVELADLYKIQFEKAGFEFQYVTNGLQAVALLQDMKPDLILLDIMLPGTNGLDVLKKIKENETTRDIIVVLLSNLPEESAKEKGMSLGASEYLVKSNHTPLEVIDKVNSLLKGKK
jgi:DNA-binding response OmpR family regulator